MSHAIEDIATPQADAASTDFLSGFISEQDFAARRGVTMRTCQRDRQLRKSPPYVQIGRRIYYRIDAVRQWLMGLEQDNTLTVKAPRARSDMRRTNQAPTQYSRPSVGSASLVSPRVSGETKL